MSTARTETLRAPQRRVRSSRRRGWPACWARPRRGSGSGRCGSARSSGCRRCGWRRRRWPPSCWLCSPGCWVRRSLCGGCCSPSATPPAGGRRGRAGGRGRAGRQALRDKTLDVDLLMIVAAVGAAAIGQVLDGGLLIVIFATSGALEAVATRRTQDSVRSLLTLAPERATRLTADGGEETVEVATLVPGDLVMGRPGERIGADGHVEDGASDVDEASITGEPLPVAKMRGAEVFAGTVNGTGALRVRVRRAAADSVVARIVAMVEQASGTKARRQLFIEKDEQRYSIGVVVATLSIFAVPLAFGAGLQSSLLRAMTFMIVASPCAVVLATMPALLSAIANAGRHGVLVKSAVVMEHLADIDAVALDKTGTLTTGEPTVVAVRPVPGGPCGEDDLLALAAAAEATSEHPVGRSIVAAARGR